MKIISWNPEKSKKLKEKRRVGFEDIVDAIRGGDVLDITPHPNPERYPKQRIFVIRIDRYVYLVPFVEDTDNIFLKTIFPSRKATKKYL